MSFSMNLLSRPWGESTPSSNGTSRGVDEPFDAWSIFDATLEPSLDHRRTSGEPGPIDVRELLLERGWHEFQFQFHDRGARVVITLDLPRRGPALRLTAREFQAADFSARGLNTTDVAARLALSRGTAHGALNAVFLKLGARRGVQLAVLWHALAGTPSQHSRPGGAVVWVFQSVHDVNPFQARLTQAERNVLSSVIRGHSNQMVAALRGTSMRTVANQVASLLRKFQASSRADLISKALGLSVVPSVSPPIGDLRLCRSLAASCSRLAPDDDEPMAQREPADGSLSQASG